MPQFMLSVYHDPSASQEDAAYADDAAMEDAFRKVAAFNEKLQADGQLVFVGALTGADEAVVVRATSEEPLAEPGPAAEGPQLGGFWVVTAEHFDAARVLAAEASTACGQPVEVRTMES